MRRSVRFTDWGAESRGGRGGLRIGAAGPRSRPRDGGSQGRGRPVAPSGHPGVGWCRGTQHVRPACRHSAAGPSRRNQCEGERQGCRAVSHGSHPLSASQGDGGTRNPKAAALYWGRPSLSSWHLSLRRRCGMLSAVAGRHREKQGVAPVGFGRGRQNLVRSGRLRMAPPPSLVRDAGVSGLWGRSFVRGRRGHAG